MDGPGIGLACQGGGARLGSVGELLVLGACLQALGVLVDPRGRQVGGGSGHRGSLCPVSVGRASSLEAHRVTRMSA